jgi:hypothetical protein
MSEALISEGRQQLVQNPLTIKTVYGSFRLFSSVFKASSAETSSSLLSTSVAASFFPFFPLSFFALRRSRFLARIFSVTSSFGPGRSKYRRYPVIRVV